MVVKIMGIGDLMTATAVVLMHYELIGWRTGLLFTAYILIKGWMFKGDIGSFLDMLCGAYMFAMLFGLTTFIDWIAAIYLFQKAVFSIAA